MASSVVDLISSSDSASDSASDSDSLLEELPKGDLSGKFSSAAAAKSSASSVIVIDDDQLQIEDCNSHVERSYALTILMRIPDYNPSNPSALGTKRAKTIQLQLRKIFESDTTIYSAKDLGIAPPQFPSGQIFQYRATDDEASASAAVAATDLLAFQTEFKFNGLAKNAAIYAWNRFMTRKRLPFMTLYIFGDSVEQGRQITLAAMELDAMRHKVVRQMYTSSNKDNTRSCMWQNVQYMQEESDLHWISFLHGMRISLDYEDEYSSSLLPKFWMSDDVNVININNMKISKMMVPHEIIDSVLAETTAPYTNITYVPICKQRMVNLEVSSDPHIRQQQEEEARFVNYLIAKAQEAARNNRESFLIVPRHVNARGTTNHEDVKRFSYDEGNHWQLVVVRITKDSHASSSSAAAYVPMKFDCFVFDSLNYKNSKGRRAPPETCMNGSLYHMLHILQNFGFHVPSPSENIVMTSLRKENVNMYMCRCSKQTDGIQCGFYTMINAMYLVKNHRIFAFGEGAHLNWREALPGLHEKLCDIGERNGKSINVVRLFFQSMYERIVSRNVQNFSPIDSILKDSYFSTMQRLGLDRLCFERNSRVFRPVTFLHQMDGNSCGVYTAIIVDHLRRYPNDFRLEHIRETCGQSLKVVQKNNTTAVQTFDNEALRGHMLQKLKSFRFQRVNRKGRQTNSIEYITRQGDTWVRDAGLDVREDGQTARERVTNGWLTTGIIDAFLFAKKGDGLLIFPNSGVSVFSCMDFDKHLKFENVKDTPLPWLIPVVSPSHFFVAYVTPERNIYVYNSLPSSSKKSSDIILYEGYGEGSGRNSKCGPLAKLIYIMYQCVQNKRKRSSEGSAASGAKKKRGTESRHD